MAKIVNGSNVLIKFDNAGTKEVIACSTSCTVNINMEEKQTVCKDDAVATDWKNFTPGLKSWDMSVDALYVIAPDTDEVGWADIVDKIINSEAVDVVFEAEDTETTPNKQTLTGSGYITSTSLTAGAQEDATFSLSITGNGKLTSTVS